MLKLGARQLLAVILCVLVVNPPSMIGASATTVAPRGVVGSIQSSGAVRVDEVLMPRDGTLFAGDHVATNAGAAVIQYRDGARISLSSDSRANFAANRVQLEKGLMNFQTEKAGVVFAVSTLRLEPTTAKTAANVTLNETKASVSVTEGTLKVVDPSGVQLAALRAGEARLFEEAPSLTPPSDPAAAAAAPPAAAPAAPPQGGSNRNGWWVAAGIGVVGLALGIAGLVSANDSSSRADAANATALQAQQAAAAAQTQLTAAIATATALQARVNALAGSLSNVASITAGIDANIQTLTRAQASINAILMQLDAGTITAANAAAQIAVLQGQINAALASLGQQASQFGTGVGPCAVNPTTGVEISPATPTGCFP